MKTLPSVPFGLAFMSILLIGLNAGFFYTWSFTVMQALDDIVAGSAITAMQSVNANIRNGWFGAIAFGAPVLLLVTALYLFGRRMVRPAMFYLAAFVAAVTTIAITMVVHVPMNNALASVSATVENAADVWSNYSEQWVRWNHLRSISSAVSFGLSVIGIVVLVRQCMTIKRHNEVATWLPG